MVCEGVILLISARLVFVCIMATYVYRASHSSFAWCRVIDSYSHLDIHICVSFPSDGLRQLAGPYKNFDEIVDFFQCLLST